MYVTLPSMLLKIDFFFFGRSVDLFFFFSGNSFNIYRSSVDTAVSYRFYRKLVSKKQKWFLLVCRENFHHFVVKSSALFIHEFIKCIKALKDFDVVFISVDESE